MAIENPPFGPEKTRLVVTDKRSNFYRVDYFKFPTQRTLPIYKELGCENVGNFEHPELSSEKAAFLNLASRAFPNYSDSGMWSLINKMDKADYFDLVYSFGGDMVAFHIYKSLHVTMDLPRPGVRLTPDDFALKTMYVDHAATDPDFESRGITTAAREAVYRLEKPDVFCGSSANGGIYVANQRLAHNLGYDFYPTSEGSPVEVVKFANRIHDQMKLRNADLDDRLVRTYTGPVSQGNRPHPLVETLDLGPTQHVFYMGISPNAKYQLDKRKR